MATHSPKIAIYMRMIYDCGVDRVMINLSRGFIDRGLKVDLVLNSAEGGENMLSQYPTEVRVVDLKAPHLSRSLPDVMRYLQQEQPTAMLVAGHFTNEIAILAKHLSRVSTRIVVSEHTSITKEANSASRLESKHWIPLGIKLFHPWADGIVAVSHGVAQDLSDITGLSSNRIQVIYNPAFTPDILEKAKQPLEHPWFAPEEPPVILGVGRLEPQKDFANLIRAFALVRQERPARLMILGEGGERQNLSNLVRELGLENDISMLGFVSNPFPYMAKSAILALSSAWEGFANILVEAMALGTPVVSTNCQSGPAEVLDAGKYGLLVQVGDSNALGSAMLTTLMGDPKAVDPDWLNQFTIESATQKYLDVLGVN